MRNLVFDLPEYIIVKALKMNPRPFHEEFRNTLYDCNSWWHTVVSNSRNDRYIYQNVWKKEGNPKYWFNCDADWEDEDWEEGFEGAEERKKEREKYERSRYGVLG